MRWLMLATLLGCSVRSPALVSERMCAPTLVFASAPTRPDPIARSPTWVVAETSHSCTDFDASADQVDRTTIGVGEGVRVNLCGPPAGGFEWSRQAWIDGDAVLQFSHQVQTAPGATPTEEDRHVWLFTAAKPGFANVTIDYDRDWDDHPTWTYQLAVTVRTN